MSAPIQEETNQETPEESSGSSQNNPKQFQHPKRENFNRRGGGGGGGGGNLGGSGPRRGGYRSHYNNNSNNDNKFNNRNNFNQSGNNDEIENTHEDNPRFVEKFQEKLAAIGGPTIDLPIANDGGDNEKKFSGRNRLYIGNINSEASEEDLKDLLGKFGEHADLFLNKERGFGFVKYDYHKNAEKAKLELDGTIFRGKNLKVRFAPNNATIKVKNVPNFVSNELLAYAFQVFGEVERALVTVDERGKPTGEGVVEFARKGAATAAVRKCNERCFFLTNSLQPVVVESFEFVTDTDGYPEKLLPKRNPDYNQARSRGPRFAELKSFEHEYGIRWKQLLELYAEKELALKKELAIEKEKLEAQMEYARYEHETEMLREELRSRELNRERQKQEWEMKERQVEEQRRRNEEHIRRREESLQARLIQQEEDMRRRQQENNLFMQAHELHNIINEGERMYGQQQQQQQQPPPPQFGNKQENYEDQPPPGPPGPPNQNMGNMNHMGGHMGNMGGGNMGGRMGGGGGGGGRGRWIDDRRDDFIPKRRRF